MSVEKTIINPNKIYTPHANQLKVHLDGHQNRVIVAGRRFGKSAMLLNEAIAWADDMDKPRQMIWLILPEYKQAKSIYWYDPDITKYYMPYVQARIFKKNDAELYLFNNRTGSYIFLKGSDNADSLRGSGLDLILWDEVADVKPYAFQTISPTLADSPNHNVIYAGTPDGYNHFHDFALMGDHNHQIEKAGKAISLDDDFITYRFTSYDNMTWAEGTFERRAFVDYIDKEKKKYYEQGLGDWYEQEYMAQFRKRAGAVHTLFDRNIHVIPYMDIPHEWYRIRGWDWGSNHPTASIRIAFDNDDNWFIENCYKKRDDYISLHAEAVKLQDGDFVNAKNEDPIPGYCDPSGRVWWKEFNNLGFSIQPARQKQNTEKKSWVMFAIDRINSKLAPRKGHTVYLPNGTKIENAPSFFILDRTENYTLVDEMETLTYKQNAQGLSKAEIDDTTDRSGHFDVLAALRYLAVSVGERLSYTSLDVEKEKMTAAAQNRTYLDLRDDETRKKLEHEADMKLIKEAQRQQGVY